MIDGLTDEGTSPLPSPPEGWKTRTFIREGVWFVSPDGHNYVALQDIIVYDGGPVSAKLARRMTDEEIRERNPFRFQH